MRAVEPDGGVAAWAAAGGAVGRAGPAWRTTVGWLLLAAALIPAAGPLRGGGGAAGCLGRGSGEREEELPRSGGTAAAAGEGGQGSAGPARGAERSAGGDGPGGVAAPASPVPAPPAVKAAPPPPPPACPDPAESGLRMFVSPERPWAGRPLRVMLLAEADRGVVAVRFGDASAPALKPTAWGGPPWAWAAVLEAPPPGEVAVRVEAAGGVPLHCAKVAVAAERPAPPALLDTGVWPVERAWDGAIEQLYSAWVGRLFLIDPGARAGWRPLHQVFRDPRRNLLYGHLGLDEDDPEAGDPVEARPDCGDVPFFLRAYFAWKLGLPFAVRHCLRGDARRGTRCEPDPETNLTDEWDDRDTPVRRFNAFLADSVANTVHSGTGRSLPEAPPGELYPVALDRSALRPGTVFVDIAGHVLVVSRWVVGSEKRIGMLLAIDGHPDDTVSHKRFSRANFFFEATLRTGGFKAFRPVRFEDGRFRFASDEEILADPGYPAPSNQQYELRSTHEFYRTVDRLANPEPLDPVAAYRSQMEAMLELLEAREEAVRIGVDYQVEKEWEVIPMPAGGAIFETQGPWEDYSTPARDLRLLIAMDELAGFIETVRENPALFRIPPDTSPVALERSLREAWNRGSAELAIEYRRSDGSLWRLTLGEAMERAERLEQAYNPNDCPEVRWAAVRGTPEFEPCVQRAPAEQRNRMSAYRHWHRERRRPSAF